ncbi:ImmA/IrrE family metallo-endopeptidase [Pseudonocardia acidicola]
MEARGVLLLQFSSLERNSCRGFLLPHDAAPVVAVNTKYNPAARLFTVFHELAHLIRGDTAICDDPRSSSTERWCEQTAAQVLAPTDDLLPYLDRWVTTGKVTSIDDCRRIANRYKISLRAAAVRLISVERAESSLYSRIDRDTDFESGGPNPNAEPQTTPVRRVAALGNEIPRELLRARDQGLLTTVQVRRYLNVDPDQLNDISFRLQTADAEA